MPKPEANVNINFSVLNDQGKFENYSPDKLNPNAPTYFVTHGLTGTADEGQPWQADIVNTIEEQTGIANVIQVTWDAPLINPTASFGGISLTNYEQAAANTETVGQKIVDTIANSDGNINPGNTTLIGHSLGAQASGWAGFIAKKGKVGEIASIVGLDPARPSFQESLNSEFSDFANGDYISPHQLNADDAGRVVAIHSSRAFGITNPITAAEGTKNPNTLDIYINGGSAFDGISGITDPFSNRSHNYSHVFFQQLLEGEGFNDNFEGEITGTKDISKLGNPLDSEADNSPFPLISLNTVLQGNENKSNQGIVDVEIRDAVGTADLPANLELNGTKADDTLTGTKTADQIEGFENGDTIMGLSGNDSLIANAGEDTLFGGSDQDTLVGGLGNDLLAGNAGADTLTGVDIGADTPGAGEIDILFDDVDKDTFALGDAEKDYYADFPNNDIDDYAIIRGFETGDRFLVRSDFSLQDSADFDLQSGQTTGGIGISINDLNGESELIAIVENTTKEDVMAGIERV
jgi:Ca2+-binding RTX toxin-like protein